MYNVMCNILIVALLLVAIGAVLYVLSVLASIIYDIIIEVNKKK